MVTFGAVKPRTLRRRLRRKDRELAEIDARLETLTENVVIKPNAAYTGAYRRPAPMPNVVAELKTLRRKALAQRERLAQWLAACQRLEQDAREREHPPSEMAPWAKRTIGVVRFVLLLPFRLLGLP